MMYIYSVRKKIQTFTFNSLKDLEENATKDLKESFCVHVILQWSKWHKITELQLSQKYVVFTTMVLLVHS